MKKTVRLLALVLAVMLMAGMMSGFGSDSKTVKMATKPMTEQFILGNMMKELIEAKTDLKVELTEGIGGGTKNIQPAMEKGEFDFYPEYTGTGWNVVLQNTGLYSEDMFEELEKGYNELGMTWTGMMGFNNTYTIAVVSEKAEEYKLATMSDLAKASENLIFGANYDFFESEDGFDMLVDRYGMSFKDTKDMDISLKYEAIKAREIDVMPAFTTDAQLTTAGVVTLEDDLGIYPSYMCGFVVRQDALEAFPELQEVFDLVTDILSDAEMSALNCKVEADGEDPVDVAHQFLVDKGLIE